MKDMFPTDDEIIEPPQLGELLAFIAVLTVLIYFSVLSGYLVKLIVISCTMCKPSSHADHCRLSLEVMTLNPICENVETAQGVPLTVTGVAQVRRVLCEE